MHRPAATKGDHGEIARIKATVERDQLQRVDHVVVGDPDDATRRLGLIGSQPLGHNTKCRRCRRHIRHHLAAAEIVTVDPAEPEVGIGRRRIHPAAPVSCRTRLCPGRLRPDMQFAEIIDPGDGAAAVADLDQIDHRHHHRIAGRGAGALDPVIGLDPHRAALDQRAFRGGAADVDGQHIGFADQLAQFRSPPEARGRAAFDHGDRDAGDRFQRIHPAIALHDIGAALQPLGAQPLGQPRQVALCHRLDIGRQHGGIGAFIFPPLAGDLVRGDDGDPGPELADFGDGRGLMFDIGVGMQERHRDGLHAFGLEIGKDRGQARQVERCHFLPQIVDPPGNLLAQVTRHKRFGLLVMQVEKVRPVAACDLQRIAKALGGDQADLYAFAFGNGIDHHGRAMRQKIHRGRIDAALGQHVQHALFIVGRRRVGFRGGDALAAIGIGRKTDQIGEGAADIGRYADGSGHHRFPLFSSMCNIRQAAAGRRKAAAAATRVGV